MVASSVGRRSSLAVPIRGESESVSQWSRIAETKRSARSGKPDFSEIQL